MSYSGLNAEELLIVFLERYGNIYPRTVDEVAQLQVAAKRAGESAAADFLQAIIDDLMKRYQVILQKNKQERPKKDCTCESVKPLNEWHPCPYEEEINDNHEPYCDCCSACTQRCVEEV